MFSDQVALQVAFSLAGVVAQVAFELSFHAALVSYVLVQIELVFVAFAAVVRTGQVVS